MTNGEMVRQKTVQAEMWTLFAVLIFVPAHVMGVSALSILMISYQIGGLFYCLWLVARAARSPRLMAELVVAVALFIGASFFL